ncbi:hypothetical protein L2Y94_03240 [Luteibacter aegosomatis]|uniref:hypothetical protein n=1 Tax=Luteibacter aegosomatis TaxID=2911537 RepID=UPI001FFBFA7D|nr:hypothetical protein [Luteibacter aegosomatis]UPG86388.1 hypothetical protein L2Y94_03240 [Luteibacter aegosomatis]
MSFSSERVVKQVGCYAFDEDATAHELLNQATEWLQYARGLSQLLADLVHETDDLDCGRMALGLEAIGELTHLGVLCAAEANARMCWQQAHDLGRLERDQRIKASR